MNDLDLAGVMALNSGLKANHTMRCLDLNIPPADEEMARYVISYILECLDEFIKHLYYLSACVGTF